MYTWYIQISETESEGNDNLQDGLVPTGTRSGIITNSKVHELLKKSA